jgi:hypothetical protein
MKKKYLIFSCLFFLFFTACKNGSDVIEKFPIVENKYNASLPIAVDKIIPTYGSIDKTFIIEGNFSGDISNMKVYFGKKRAVLVSTDGRCITGVIPKQLAGYNSVSVVIGTDSLAPAALKFKYKQTQSVKTIAGKFGDGADYVDGDINAARFKEASNIGTVKGQKGDNIIVVESWWNDRVRLISLDDNKVITLNTGMACGTPGVDNTREKFYLVGHWPDQHTIYSFSRADGWTPRLVGIKIAQSDMPGDAFSCQIGKDNNFLFVLDGQGNFARVDLKNQKYEKIKLAGTLPTKFDMRSQLIYSKFHDCFFASFPQEAGIFKIYNNNGTWTCEKYAGFNGAGSTTGHRLTDAQFIAPYGMAVNEDGEIFVINRDGNFINKISGDRVELVAGKPGSGGQVNGLPLDSRFDSPQDIAIDADGNFYIAGGWDKTVRKLSIE